MKDHVAVITLNRPERHNALNRRAYDEVRAAFLAASAGNDVRCVVVLPSARWRSNSGEDVKEMMMAKAGCPGPQRAGAPAADAAAMAALGAACR